MTMNFDEEEITNQSEEVKINYEENGKVPTEIVKKLMGRKTSRRVLKTWNEDFVDEDNGEVVSIERNEIIVDKNTIIDRDVLDEIINVQAKSVFIHKFQ
jgi:DNA-directed RNA polymerase subunit beta